MKFTNFVKRAFMSITAIAVVATSAAFLPQAPKVEAATTTVNNPFIWADVPDVDVIRVGDTYYMVSTTMYFSPGAPIMKSNDLVSWEICNYVYDRYADGDVQNLTNGKHDYAHGQWATSLRYHKGTYYVFFGSYGSGKSYIYKTNDIEHGTWTRSELNGMYHDASLFFDDDGRNYLIYGGGGNIEIKELNAEMTGFKQGGASKRLFSTGLDNLAGEGAHVHKIGDYYYVFIIAWPSNSGRIELCYRSKDILGNYEGKTVLNSGLGTYGAGVAQGGIVDTPDGKWYGMLFQDHGAVGRIPVLVPVTWQDGWPMMGVNGKAPLTISVDGTNGTPAGTYLVRDDSFDYSSNQLALQWQWNHNPDNSAWSVTQRPGYLRLTNKSVASHLLAARNTLTTRTEGPACSSVIKLDTSGMKAGDRAGLAAFQFNFGQVGVLVADDGSKKVYYANNGNYSGNSDVLASRENIVQQENLRGNEVYLKIDFQFATVNNGSSSNNIDKANFFYSYDGANWTKIGNTLGMTYDLKLFTGYRSAIYSYGTKSTGGYADIDFFDYERQAWNEGTDANKPAGPVEPIEPDENGYFYHSTYEDGLDSWAGRGPAAVEASGSESYDGSKSMFVSGRTSAWNGAARPLNAAAFEPGKEYSFSADVLYNTGDATDTFYMKLQYTDASGETMYDSIAEATVVKGEWTQLANTNYKIPADASNMQIYIETAESTIDFYVDEAIGGVEGTTIDGPTPISFIPGDITCDGVINGFDVAAAKKGMANVLPTVAAERAADVNKSGALDADDVAQIQAYVIGKIDAFSAKAPSSDAGNNNTGAVTVKGDWDNYVETATPAMQTFYANAIHNMGNTARLRAKVAKAQSGEKTTVAYIGGSITEGVGAADTCYAKRSFDYFSKTFGTGSNVSYINAGMSGTSSAVGLMRAQRDILNANPDVIFIEFSVNDHPGDTYTKSFEGLVKKCLMQENEPAVIIIINRSKGGYSMQDQMSKVGKNYNVPIISMDDALTKAFASGTLKDSDYFSDEYHPHANDSALIADSIAYYYRQALKTANKSDSYTIPTTTAYGDEYATGSIVPVSELSNLNAGAFKAERSNTRFEYGFTYQKNTGNAPLKFTTQGKGIFLVFKSNQNSSLGNIVVTVNGKTSKINGNRQYAWGGADAEIAYIQNTSGTLEVSMNMENAGSDFNIWGIGVIK
ncbi:MAG: family 43 glycosylhydrolase [Oscillospiraceae bacterium]|nr:family 43 glycosylhydrolase [Oscillospiraceae bacterium]